MDTGPSQWINALQGSHDRLRTVVEPLDAGRLEGPSYASDWSIAQVLSHLGSGAEIFNLFLDAGLSGDEPPAREQFEPIWASWNAKSAQEQAADALASDAAFVKRISSLNEAQRDSLRLALFGMELDIVGLMRLRLGEHAVHTWDIAVAVDDTATVAPDAVALLVDTLSQLVARSGKATDVPLRLGIHTTDPDRDFVLEVGDSATLTGAADATGSAKATGSEGDAELHLPAEALVRLVYGRLDPDHSPVIESPSVDIDILRGVFPGF